MDSTVYVVGVLAAVVVLVFLVQAFRGNSTQRTKANFKGPLNTEFSVEASNDPAPITPGIRVKGATSREGGVLADDQTGRGIDAEQLDARDDVLLTSASPKPDRDPKA